MDEPVTDQLLEESGIAAAQPFEAGVEGGVDPDRTIPVIHRARRRRSPLSSRPIVIGVRVRDRP